MVYLRKPRPSYYFDGRTPTGWRQVCAKTPDKRLAQKIEAMWADLAEAHRAWDLLTPVLNGALPIGRLYDHWMETRQDVAAIRRLLADVDVAALVPEWHQLHASAVKADSAAHALAHVRWLLPEGTPRLASTVTTEWLTARLAAYDAKRSTRRKVHSSWSMFFAFCADVKNLYARNPMEKVARPKLEPTPIRFYELETVERIVDAQPTPERRALFALLYGTGMEITVALSRTRADVDPVAKSVRAPGTKTHTRDRVARVADWAWPLVWEHVRAMTPHTRLFPATWNRWTASDWHRETVDVLSLRDRHPMKNARHHWAVRRLRSGSSIYDVQRQLGHESPTLTLRVYGQFMPSAEDRDAAEAKATDYETKRRATK